MNKKTRETLYNQRFSSKKLMPATGIEPVPYCYDRILSPARLPVPPRRHLMGGGGFEPPKQFAADLQSVPFGHSGIHPFQSEKLLTRLEYSIIVLFAQANFLIF